MSALFGVPLCLVILFGWLFSQRMTESEPMSFTILQLNDVYEIAPLPGTDEGGMARVAAFRKELYRADQRLITVLAGDFLSPSVLGTLSEPGDRKPKKIAGKHMVDVMNATGVDLVTFGNHEFDIGQDDLQLRIDESRFDWIASNVLDTLDAPFKKRDRVIPPYTVRKFKYGPGKVLQVGIIGVTLQSNYKYAKVSDYTEATMAAYKRLKRKCQVVIALTHLDYKSDSILARNVPGLNLIIGGHEHERNYQKVGKTIISKADANVKTVYVHNICYDPQAREVRIQSRVKGMDTGMRSDPAVERLVDQWTEKCFDLLRAKGYEPMNEIYTSKEKLNGLESDIRDHGTNYTKLITEAMYWAADEKYPVIFNSGSLRLDDRLSNTVTEYDVCRSLPFGGKLSVVEIPGKDLVAGVVKGMKDCKLTDPSCMKGSGGFLHGKHVELKDNVVYIRGNKVDPNRTYKVLMPSYVADGHEKGLEILKGKSNSAPAIRKETRNNITDIVIAYMKMKMASSN